MLKIHLCDSITDTIMSSGHTHMFYLFALGIVGWFSNEEKKEISIKKKQMPQFKFKLN